MFMFVPDNPSIAVPVIPFDTMEEVEQHVRKYINDCEYYASVYNGKPAGGTVYQVVSEKHCSVVTEPHIVFD